MCLKKLKLNFLVYSATFFTQNGVAGACGTVHQDSDMIAAIDESRYGNSGQKSALCGRKVKILNPANGKSVTVTIADDCPTCKNSNSIDLSVSAFTQIATKAQGMVGSESTSHCTRASTFTNHIIAFLFQLSGLSYKCRVFSASFLAHSPPALYAFLLFTLDSGQTRWWIRR